MVIVFREKSTVLGANSSKSADSEVYGFIHNGYLVLHNGARILSFGGDGKLDHSFYRGDHLRALIV